MVERLRRREVDFDGELRVVAVMMVLGSSSSFGRLLVTWFGCGSGVHGKTGRAFRM